LGVTIVGLPEIAHSGYQPAIVERVGIQKSSLNCVGLRDRLGGVGLAAGGPHKIP